MVSRGFYRHYKGGVYFVEGVGTLHDDGRRVVVYQSTQSAVDGNPRLRFEDEFEEFVDPATGERMKVAWRAGSSYVPRFHRLADDAIMDVR